MAAPVGMHADAIPLNTLVGDNLLSASDLGGYGWITDAVVAAANTVDGLQAAIEAASAHSDQIPAKDRFILAIEFGEMDGSITDARIASLTTVAQLIALTNASVTDSIQQQMPE